MRSRRHPGPTRAEAAHSPIGQALEDRVARLGGHLVDRGRRVYVRPLDALRDRAPGRVLAPGLLVRDLAFARSEDRLGRAQDQHQVRARQQVSENPNERRRHTHAVAAWVDGNVPPPTLDDDEATARSRRPDPEQASKHEVQPVVTERNDRQARPVWWPTVRISRVARLRARDPTERGEDAWPPVEKEMSAERPLADLRQPCSERGLPRAVGPGDDNGKAGRMRHAIDDAPERSCGERHGPALLPEASSPCPRSCSAPQIGVGH